MYKYNQISIENRIQITTLMKEGKSLRYIAETVGYDPSTISREIRRNGGPRVYNTLRAHLAAEQRKHGRRIYKLGEPERAFVKKMLNDEQWSPEQISDAMKEKPGLWAISHEWIYRFVYEEKRQGGFLWKNLRQGRRRRRKRRNTYDRRGQIPNRTFIDERPVIVAKKRRIGDWEADTLIGEAHKNALLVLNERKTRFTIIEKLESREDEHVARVMVKSLKRCNLPVFTITSDNGKEFTRHEWVACRLGCNFYFAHPYASHERGLNENTCGLIRQYFPKKTNFDDITLNHVDEVERKLNTRPRKSMKFLSPLQVLSTNKNVALVT